MGNLEPRLPPALDPDPLVRDEYEWEDRQREPGPTEALWNPGMDDFRKWCRDAQTRKQVGIPEFSFSPVETIRFSISLDLRYYWPDRFGREAVREEWLKAKRENQ